MTSDQIDELVFYFVEGRDQGEEQFILNNEEITYILEAIDSYEERNHAQI